MRGVARWGRRRLISQSGLCRASHDADAHRLCRSRSLSRLAHHTRLPARAGFVSEDNVYRVCDQPHPLKVRGIVEACATNDIEKALRGVAELWQQGA